MDSGGSALLTVPGDSVVNEFIDKTKEHDLVFAVAMSKLYDGQSTTETNLEALKELKSFASWIGSNTEMPDFGENVTVNNIEVLEDIPSLAIDNDAGMCKRQLRRPVTDSRTDLPGRPGTLCYQGLLQYHNTRYSQKKRYQHRFNLSPL